MTRIKQDPQPRLGSAYIIVIMAALALGIGAGVVLRKHRSKNIPPADAQGKSRSSHIATRHSSGTGTTKGETLPEAFVSAQIDSAADAGHFLRRAMLANGSQGSASTQALMDWAKRDPQAALDFFIQHSPILQASSIRSAAFRIIIEKLGLEQVENAVLNVKDKGREKALLRGIFAALASSAPREAFAFATRHNTWADSASIANALTAIAKESPMDAFALAESIPSRAEKANARLAIADAWGDSDPLAVLEWLKTEPSAFLRGKLLNQALADLARIDFPGALQQATQITGMSGRRDALRSVIKEQAKLDPASAIALLDGISNPRERNAVAGAMTDLWALSPEIVREMLRRPDLQNSGLFAVETIIAREVLRDGTAALAYIKTLPSEMQTKLEILWCHHMGNSAPEVAIKYLAEADVNIHHGDAIKILADRLALKNPETAVDWARELEHSVLSEDARYYTLSKMAERFPQETASAIDRIDKQDRTHAISYVGQAWAEQSPQDAIDWLESVRHSEDVAVAFGETIGVTANQDVELARDMFHQLSTTHPEILEQPAAMTAVNKIGQNWEGDRFVDGSEWVATLPEGNLRKEAAMGLMEPLAGMGPMQLYAHLNQVNQPDLRDAGLRIVARELYFSDLESALGISAEIRDASYRIDSLNITLGAMMKENPAAVMKFLQSEQIPSSDIPVLMERLGIIAKD